jgi:hypothetical protein
LREESWSGGQRWLWARELRRRSGLEHGPQSGHDHDDSEETRSVLPGAVRAVAMRVGDEQANHDRGSPDGDDCGKDA